MNSNKISNEINEKVTNRLIVLDDVKFSSVNVRMTIQLELFNRNLETYVWNKKNNFFITIQKKHTLRAVRSMLNLYRMHRRLWITVLRDCTGFQAPCAY